MNIREFSHNLEKLYAEMAAVFSSYQGATGLACLAGCGRCCMNPEIEASLYEMIPMALAIYDEGKLDEWVERLEAGGRDNCEAYVSGARDGEGTCGRYNERPSVCRMFGVAGRYDKQGSVTLSICRYIREHHGVAEGPVNLPLAETPMMVDWSYRLAALEPKLIQEKLPINKALLKALQKVALYATYQENFAKS
jgi:Fe-S-cluster containining protein